MSAGAVGVDDGAVELAGVTAGVAADDGVVWLDDGGVFAGAVGLDDGDGLGDGGGVGDDPAVGDDVGTADGEAAGDVLRDPRGRGECEATGAAAGVAWAGTAACPRCGEW